ncbi:MAG: MBL fold metallo-hydrolase [Planctomycetes bacterium]|nr:MBL fold metallo-hydrolase [Planctomycetota bacterium]
MPELGCKVTIVVDNLVYRQGLCGEAGLATLIETSRGAVMLDTGQGIALGHNLWELFPGLDRLSALALSHGHMDHTGGIGALTSFLGLDVEMPSAAEAFPALFAHPDIERRKYSKRSYGFREIGLTESLDVYFPHEVITLSTEPLEMIPGVTFLGELPRIAEAPWPPGHFFRMAQDSDEYEPDPLLDDTALVVDGSEGIVVVTGCTHSGLDNLAASLEENFHGRPVQALIGGLHIGSADADYMARSVDALRRIAPALIVPHHCSGIGGYEKLKDVFGDAVELGFVGQAYTFS